MRQSNSAEIKDINKTLASLGFTNGVGIQVVRGRAKNEGVYNVNVSLVTLVDKAEKDNILFTTESLGKLEVSGELTGFLLKEAIASLYAANKGSEISA